MEKVLLSLTLSVLLLATTDSFAQDSKLGIRAGINLVSFSGVDAALINDQNAGFLLVFTTIISTPTELGLKQD